MFLRLIKPLTALGTLALLCTLAMPPALAQAPKDVNLLDKLRKTEADPALSANALKHGSKVADFCANCHGANGNSTHPTTPNLAGQNPAYLIEQMLKFADGRRSNDFMQGLIKAMNTDERIGVAMYYARQSVTTRAPGEPALAAQGKAYYDKLCFACHGTDGHGNENFARLAGQQPTYVEDALKRYRADNGKRQNPLMTAATRQMDDPTIRAVAAYIASMP